MAYFGVFCTLPTELTVAQFSSLFWRSLVLPRSTRFILTDLICLLALVVLVLFFLGEGGVIFAGLGSLLWILLVVGIILLVCGALGRHRHQRGWGGSSEVIV